MNDHQGDGVTRVWFALVLLCRVAASFNKKVKFDSQRLALSIQADFEFMAKWISQGVSIQLRS
ncbi:hypothetical protein [Vibrio sp. 10N.222.55.A1]|uniref:hypothetical protein n=1 Tax=Vibrio sp. 10N.222.55.A1 TaxID=3229646 RepID=UPI00354FCB9D